MSKLTAKVEGFIFTARKRSLGQGNIFTPVCHSVHGGGGWYPSMHCRWYPSMPCRRGVLSQHALQVVSQHALQQGVCYPRIPCNRGGMRCAPGGGCLVDPPRTATAVGGTHPTGMHSCVQIKLHA